MTTRDLRLASAAVRRLGGLRCVLERLEDRGNRAAVLRTAEALGLLNVHEVSPAHPEQGRARGVAHGGEKWLRLRLHDSPESCVHELHSEGFVVLAALPPVLDVPPSASWHQKGRGASEAVESTVASASKVPARELVPVPLETIDFGRPTALVFGNERLGVSADLLAVCDGAFTIPMYGLTESLNVSVAAALAMHFGRVSRMAALRAAGTGLNESGGDLSEAEVAELLEEYRGRGKNWGKPERGDGEASGRDEAGDPPRKRRG